MTHQPLIDKLQAAEAGSRGLDEDMMRSLGWAWVPRHQIIPLTTSLDAILDEIERMFPDADLTFERLKHHPWAVVIMKAGWLYLVEATHKSAPLAACIALLRAIEGDDK